MFLMKIDSKIFPLGPSSIQKKESNKNETITLINEGEVNRRRPPGLRDYTIDFVIPGVEYPFAYYPGGKFVTPFQYIEFLRALKQEKKAIKIIVTRKYGSQKLNSAFISNCTIEDFTETESAENGLDREISLNIKGWRYYGTKKVKIKGTSTGNVKHETTTNRAPSSKNPKTTTYTVKSGDTLQSIAKRKLGSYSRWKEIYNLNKSVIESAAKKRGKKSSNNGQWIFPGTKLKIPAAYSTSSHIAKEYSTSALIPKK